MTPDKIEREVTIAAPVERVWSVLTGAEHINRWFTDSVELDLRPGGSLVMHWDEHGTVRARVEAVEAPHRFAYRWTAHYAEAGAEPDATNSTLVEFTLAPHGDMTRLRVVESGFASLATSDEKRRSNYDANVDGWKQVIGQLDAHVAEVAV